MTAAITLDTADGAMPALEAIPDGQARGGVVVIQDAFGLTAHLGDICTRLAAAGWRAVAPALFHRNGAPVIAYDDIPGAFANMTPLTVDGIDVDVSAALGRLEDAGHPAASCGIIGFCMGGSVATYAAASREVGAAVSFYGGGVREGRMGIAPLVELAPLLLTPWLGLYGEADASIPLEQIDALDVARRGARVDTELVRYPGAKHAFNCDARPDVFDPAAAADAWRRTLAHLDQHLGGDR